MNKPVTLLDNDSSMQKIDTSTSKQNVIESSIAVVRMTGSFSESHNASKYAARKTEKSPVKPETKKEKPITRKNTNPSEMNPRKASLASGKNGELARSFNSQLSRFNPFNKNQQLSDDDEDEYSRSNTSDYTSTTTSSDLSGDVSLAELGLTEDYFAHPKGLFGMSSLEELEGAIENCKALILEYPEKSERRKKYVKKLVELRMKHQELKEGPDEIEPRIKQVLCHRLRKKGGRSMKHYCDCCNNLIWGMLQIWYKCRACSFTCHAKCVNAIRRECVAVGISNVNYTLNICPEIGLSAQQFHCAECKNPISITGTGHEEARLCNYTGQYFCPHCHWNDTIVSPAHVMHNWDFTVMKVSRRSYQLLNLLEKRPLLNVELINPMLFNYVEELADIRKLREDIILMKAYFTTCTVALKMKLLLELKDRQHFVDGSQMYSLSDLIQAVDGKLTENLTNLHALFAHHIKLDCMYCQAKGFICEICNSGETLFPFDFGVATCSKCSAVFHRDCFSLVGTLCPRCERQQRRKRQRSIVTDLCSSGSDTETNYMKDDTLPRESVRNLSHTIVKDPDYHNKTRENVISRDFESLTISSPKLEDVVSNEPEGASKRSDCIPIDQDSSIKDSANNKHNLTSLHMLLTDSSYTDYAMLGFAGVGKGRNSISISPSELQETSGNPFEETNGQIFPIN